MPAGYNQIEPEEGTYEFELSVEEPEVCELDLQLMNSALGTAVKREACVANGDAVCTFHIQSQPIQLQT